MANTDTTTGCVTAGTADGITRTYMVTISNANGSDSGTCTYVVGSAAAMAPTVTILGLRVNGVTMPCMSHVNPGDTVCVRFQTDQTATATVSIKKGTGMPTTIASGTVSPGPVFFTCVTAGMADGITRTFTVTLSNTNGTNADTCTYIVP